MTSEEKQEIISAVLSALATNSKTIAQLTPVTALNDDDSFEVSGGKRITFLVLRQLIEAASSQDTSGLLSLINAKELSSASVVASDDGATVTLKVTNAGGAEVSATLPIASSTKAGVITATTFNKINTAYNNAENALTQAAAAMAKATQVETAQGNKADLESSTVQMLKTTQWPDVMLYNVVPISPLDIENYDWNSIPVGSIYLEDGLNGNVPYRKLFKKTSIEQGTIVDLGNPQQGTIYCHKETGNTYRWDQSADSNLGEFVQIGSLGSDTVREFSAVIDTATITQGTSAKKSTDSDCQVFYVTALNQFVLGVRNSAVPSNWPGADVQPVHLMALNVAHHDVSVSPNQRFSDLVVSDLVHHQTLIEYFNFYLDWADRELFSDDQYVPIKNKLYICTSSDVSYYFNTDAGTLTAISDPGLEARLFFNGNVLTGKYSDNITLAQFVALTTGDAFAYVRRKGVVITLSTPNGLKSYQWKGNTWSDTESDWQGHGGSAAVGNCYNVTNEVPTTGYYSLTTAVAATYAKGLAATGMQITFEVGENTWKTFQYIGSDTTESNFKNLDNWVDMAGLAAGDEAVINILDLCGACTQAQYYTLQYAIAAITTKETATGITYKKSGLVITYPVGDNLWETKQFNGNVTDFGVAALWKDFGGGGNDDQVETSDEPEEGGEDAFSTGGAYNYLAAGAEMLESSEAEELIEDADTENYNYFILVNIDGTRLGNPFGIPKGGGSGGGTTKTFAINFQTSPFYASAGGQFIINAAIRSVTMDGANEQTNTIERVDIVEPSTGQVFYSNPSLNKASSATGSTYDFSFDLSRFFTAAATRRLQFVAYDDEGSRATRTIIVKAVDVTVESVQVLNYSDASVVFTTDNVKSLPMYKFPNNQGSIIAKVEMYYSGAWRTLGEATITDTYAHNISVNPNNAFGGNEQLYHGAYPIRIQGTDVESGVKGNIIYSCIMVVSPSSTQPVVALRYNDTGGGYVRRFDTIELEVAIYDPQNYNASVQIEENDEVIATVRIARNRVEIFTRQITNGSDGDTLTYRARSVRSYYSASDAIHVTIQGSAIDAALSDGASYNFDFSARTNSEVDHTIASGQNNRYTITLEGVNWSSNGFNNYLGANALAIKENVKAVLNDAPFSSADIESSGYAILFQFAANNIKDNDAKLMECYDPASGAGFYVTGKHVAICCKTGVNAIEVRNYPLGEKITVGIVVEPAGKYVERAGTRYSLIKMYLNGEEAACLGYVPSGSNLLQSNNITFNGESGDFYLYYLIGWYNYFEWQQQFYNYLVKLTNTSAMMAEYDFEDVYEGGTLNGPSMSKLAERGMPYLIESPFQGSNIEALDNTTSTSDQIFITLTYRHPERPWWDFIAYNVRRRNQGTTSAKRPIKNARYNLARKSKNNATYEVDGVVYTKVCIIKPLHTREEIVEMGYDGALWDEAAALMNKNKIRVGENTIPVDVITVKVDYSDSTNVNDCGACDIMNASYRALGGKFLTPAQRYFDGTYEIGDVELTGLQLNHSTANHPIAMFRDPSGTGANTYFYAKGNWKEDKGEQVALGFKDTPGYNKGCLNYQDESFVEYFGLPEDDTIQKVVDRFVAEVTEDPNAYDQSSPILLSMYCGSSYKFYRYVNGAWTDTTGTMKMVNGHWQITGDVLNPVDGYELLAYTGMDWFMGVASVADMMAPVQTSASWVQKLQEAGQVTGPYPAWTQFFECMVDNDQLQIDLATGKKVPYNLYALLRFCNSCDYTQVSGFKSIWYNHLRYFANPRALMVYDGFTDYLAAIDQQAKNMQPMFFLDEGQSVVAGVYQNNWCNQTFSGYQPALIMYPNKVYDADGLLGKDNDGGATVDPEVDPNKPTDVSTGYNNPYAGYGSILWNNIYQQPTVLDDDGAEISMQTVISALRSAQATFDGVTMAPFSPEGAMHFFMENIAYKWQKVVSSYDGERKFINFTPTADAIYFYALHGLRLTSIPAFIQTRFRIRDGFYRTGLFFSGVFSARINCASGAGITIKAAKTGYFGLGIDSSGDLKESVYLEAGESHTFTQFMRGDGTSIEGALLYIYQCDRIAEINFNEISLSDVANFNVFTLAQKIEIGGEGHVTMGIGSYGALSNLNLGELPFLEYLDVRDTVITTINASRCPRLETLLADGSSLTSVSLAETSPVTTLTLPASITDLTLVNLPKLSYPADANGGMTFDGMANITKLMIGGSPQIDGAVLLANIVSAGATLSRIRVADMNATGASTTLLALMNMGVIGLAADGSAYAESNQCSGLTGTWIMTDMIDDSVLASIQSYFPELDVYNLQYTMIEFDDTVSADGNITNLENGTKDGVLNGYEPSGHISRIKDRMHAYAGQYDSTHQKLLVQQISDSDINSLADGTSIDIADLSGNGIDIFIGLPHYWYKGINDHRNQKKYIAFSTEDSEPHSTASRINRGRIGDYMMKANVAVSVASFSVGDVFSQSALSENSSYNVYSRDVEGMKQVRWPGISSLSMGALFLDKEGKVLSTVTTNITHANSDFIPGEDYLFIAVPANAATFVFTSPKNCDDMECIAVDSAAIEAIEPDWVEHGMEFIGVYKASIDSQMRLRSISHANIIYGKGNGDSVSSSHWRYDANGDLTVGLPDNSTVISNMKYTCTDFQNLGKARGSGYQIIDYEMHKNVANLWMAFNGRRNSQGVNGTGIQNNNNTGQASKVTGGTDSTSNPSPFRETVASSNANTQVRCRTLGFEDWWANYSEWMDNVAVNVASYDAYYKTHGSGVTDRVAPAGSVADGIWHIRMPDGTERAVRGVTTGGDNVEICRVRNGRFADVVPSRVTNVSNYVYNTYYCDGVYYAAETGRCVFRSGVYATSGNSGIVFVYSSYAGSRSYGVYGSRLAFRGAFEIV